MSESLTDTIADKQTLEEMVNADKQSGNLTPEDIQAHNELSAENDEQLEIARVRSREQAEATARQLAREAGITDEGNNWRKTK